MSSNATTTPILDVPISRFGFDEAIRTCRDRVTARLGGYVCFANVHSVTESLDDPELKRALTDAFLALADGVPLVWASRLRGEPITSRVCGPDFMSEFLCRFPELRHAFVGGAVGIGKILATRFSPGAMSYSPPMRPYSQKNSEDDWNELLRTAGLGRPPDVVWVGLGAPKQEYWMRTVSKLAPETLFFGVGAAFDFLAGTKRRAPRWMQKIGLEWFYRLASEPRRLWKRYLKTNFKFVTRVLFTKS